MMENTLQIKLDDLLSNSIPNKSLIENRIETLRSLAALLLREVENLQTVPQLQDQNGSREKIDLYDEVSRFEANLIRDALIRSKGHQRQAAKLLGTKVSTLNTKIKRFGIEIYEFVGKI